jgi:hypothetical protein
MNRARHGPAAFGARHRVAFCWLLVAAALSSRNALAEEAITADGVYGRFDGDLDLSVAAGPAWSSEGASGAILARALFLETAGLYLSYADQLDNSGAGPHRSVGIGVALRPLFVPRWGYNLERGPAVLDLAIDATTIELGALWTADPSPHFSRPPGVELALGTEMPLGAHAEGLWVGVRGSLRWRDSELSGAGEDPPLRPVILFTVAWHLITGAHLVDAGDRRLR